MPPSSVIGALRDHIGATVAGAPPVGAAVPAAAADIPRITVSLEDIVPAIRGLGGVPSSPIQGALRVETAVDLADPVLHAAGEDVALLSPDRRTLQLPHGAVVRASGDDTPPYGTGDLLSGSGIGSSSHSTSKPLTSRSSTRPGETRSSLLACRDSWVAPSTADQ